MTVVLPPFTTYNGGDLDMLWNETLNGILCRNATITTTTTASITTSTTSTSTTSTTSSTTTISSSSSSTTSGIPKNTTTPVPTTTTTAVPEIFELAYTTTTTTTTRFSWNGWALDEHSVRALQQISGETLFRKLETKDENGQFDGYNLSSPFYRVARYINETARFFPYDMRFKPKTFGDHSQVKYDPSDGLPKMGVDNTTGELFSNTLHRYMLKETGMYLQMPNATKHGDIQVYECWDSIARPIFGCWDGRLMKLNDDFCGSQCYVNDLDYLVSNFSMTVKMFNKTTMTFLNSWNAMAEQEKINYQFEIMEALQGGYSILQTGNNGRI
jgi:hypothetical protein